MTDTVSTITAGQLKTFIERIERLEEEKKTISDDINDIYTEMAAWSTKAAAKTISDDIKDIYTEAKGTGFDIKVLRKIVSMRKQDQHERKEQDELLSLYLHALGMES